MKKLFLDVDGVLLTKKEPRIANDALTFIDFALKNFDCYWLTTHCKGHNAHVISYLSKYFENSTMNLLHQVKSTSWSDLKTEAIGFDDDFVWLDDCPFEAELKVLQECGALNRLIIVDLNNKNELTRIIALLTEICST